MAKNKLLYSCTQCGAQAPKWTGQCGDCGAWNSLTEIAKTAPLRAGRFAGFAGDAGQVQLQRLADVTADDVTRQATGINEFDRVLGGGLVPGSVVLIGGDPGIGKSTILLQTLVAMGQDNKAMYVTGEESLQQVSMRAQRLGLVSDDLQLMAETRIEQILATANKQRPDVMVVDSIQTVYTEELQSAPGAVAQVRESAAQLVRYAKQSQTALFLVGLET